MKTFLTFLVFCFLQTMPCPGQVLFHEDFEVPDSVIHYTSSGGFWGSNSRLQAGGLFSDSLALSMPGDSIYIRTNAFSTVGFNDIYLKFDHICKIEFFDQMSIWVSPDSGLSWVKLRHEAGGPFNNCAYMGNSLFATQSANFQEASYAAWLPGTDSVPQNSWWKTELFDISTLLFNCQNAMVMFVLKDRNNNGPGIISGTFFLDNLLIKTNLFPDGTQVKGSFYLDTNLNNIKDPGEQLGNQRWKWVIDTLSHRHAGTYLDYYSILWRDTTSYFIVPNLIPYYNIVPASYSNSLSVNGQVDSLLNFGYQILGNYDDLELVNVMDQAVRCNDSCGALIFISNVGTTTLTPTVTLVLDTSLSFVSASIPPNLINGDTITWNLSSMAPFAYQSIYLDLLTDSLLSFGATIYNYAYVDPLIGDQTPLNNQDSSASVVISSFDPNVILADRDTLFSWELSDPPFIEYQIQFQNTGNDTAFNISVLNTIPPEFDILSFEFIGSSHPTELTFNYNLNTMFFQFENILLPDSNVNEAQSHGYLFYRIKPLPGLFVPSAISNQAKIYFDYNVPVATNTAITSIVVPTWIANNDSVVAYGLKFYPNPTSGISTVDLYGWMHEKLKVSVLDLMGRQVARLFEGEITSERRQITCDLSSLPSGMYILSLQSENRKNQVRLLKY